LYVTLPHHNAIALRIPPADVQVDDMTLDVTELPLRKWTQDYKEFLEGLIKPEEKAGPAILADYREHHSDADVHFSMQLLPGQMDHCLAAGLHSKFKLLSKVSCGKQGQLTSHTYISSWSVLKLIERSIMWFY